MYSVINRKIYDTNQAEEIASDYYGYTSDFDYWAEILYRSHKGAWFLLGDGGANTRWGVDTGSNSRTGGSRIVPLSPDEAFDWLEEHSSATIISQHFREQLEEA
jgi:hypothetical protein